MTLRKIAHIGHPILRQTARTLTREELLAPDMQRFIDDLVETMRDANGAGLAAPQIYESVMICALEVKKNPRYPYKPDIPLTVAVNPTIEFLTDERFDNYEGCLSVPNFRGLVPRCTEIRVRYWDREGNEVDTSEGPHRGHLAARGRPPLRQGLRRQGHGPHVVLHLGRVRALPHGGLRRAREGPRRPLRELTLSHSGSLSVSRNP